MEPASLWCLFVLTPMLFCSVDLSLGQLSLPTIKVHSAGKDVFRGYLANEQRRRQHSFNGPFSAQARLAGNMTPFWILLELRMMEPVVTTGTIRRAKLQSNRHHQQTFYTPDTLPVTQTPVRQQGKSVTFHGLAQPRAHVIFSVLVLDH